MCQPYIESTALSDYKKNTTIRKKEEILTAEKIKDNKRNLHII